jgi:hypothetical protein
MRKIGYTFVEVQCSVLVAKEQDIAANGVFGSVIHAHLPLSNH